MGDKPLYLHESHIIHSLASSYPWVSTTGTLSFALGGKICSNAIEKLT